MALVDSYRDSGVLCTLRVNDPPSPTELERRLRAGCLPYPCQMLCHLVPAPTAAPPSTHEVIMTQTPPKDEESGQRAHKIRLANERDRSRQERYAELLRSHYVPLVPFNTVLDQQEGPRTSQTIEGHSEMSRQVRQIAYDEEYVMCAGFHPHPWLYNHRGGRGAMMEPQPAPRLDRMFPRDVALPPPRHLPSTKIRPFHGAI